MVVNIGLALIVLIFTLVIQTTVVPYIGIRGSHPNLVLIVVALYGFARGPASGAVFGFFGGLLQDLLVGQPVGLGPLSKSIVGYLSGLVQRALFLENIILPMTAIFIASVMNELIFASFTFLFGYTFPFLSLFLERVLPSALYNALLAPLVYFLLKVIVLRDRKTVELEGFN